jgi:hypothetical protein
MYPPVDRSFPGVTNWPGPPDVYVYPPPPAAAAVSAIDAALASPPPALPDLVGTVNPPPPDFSNACPKVPWYRKPFRRDDES